MLYNPVRTPQDMMEAQREAQRQVGRPMQAPYQTQAQVGRPMSNTTATKPTVRPQGGGKRPVKRGDLNELGASQIRKTPAESLYQAQAQWDNLPSAERAKYVAGGTQRPSMQSAIPMAQGMRDKGLMQAQAMPPSKGQQMNGGMLAQMSNDNGFAPQMMAQNQSNPTAGATGATGAAGNAPARPGNRPVVIAPPTLPAPAPTPTMGFDADTMTVEGRLQGLMASDNPLMQQARLQAQQESAARGLQNSSLAVQSGQQAAYASMMPIASQDANTVYDSEKTEYGTRADSALMNQDYLNSRGLAEQGFGYDTSLMDQDIEGKKAIQLDRFGQETQLQEQDITGRKELQTDAQLAATARDAIKFTTDTSLQAQDITGRKELQTDAQAATTARDALKFTTDTTLQQQGITGRSELATLQAASNEKIAAGRNATAIATQTIGANAQMASAASAASAATAVASMNNAAAAARQETQIQGQALLNAQNQSYQESNMDKAFINDQTLQTERVNASQNQFAADLDSRHQLSYAGGITTLQVGKAQEHSAIAQNPEMNSTEKANAHSAVTTRFETDSSLLSDLYRFGG